MFHAIGFVVLSYYFFCLQDKIMDDLGSEMDSTSNWLDFVQVSSTSGTTLETHAIWIYANCHWLKRSRNNME